MRSGVRPITAVSALNKFAFTVVGSLNWAAVSQIETASDTRNHAFGSDCDSLVAAWVLPSTAGCA